MRPINLCLASMEYPPQTGGGGIGTQTYHRARGLSARGHNVHVVSLSWDAQARTYQDGAATIHRIPEIVLDVPGYELCSYWMAFSSALAAKICSLQKEMAFDIIQFPEYGGEGFCYMTDTDRYRQSRYVVQMHGPLAMFAQHWGWPQGGSVMQRVGCFMEETSLRLADRHLASTAHTAAYCQKAYGVDTSNAGVVYSGIDAGVFKPLAMAKDDGGPNILFVGTINEGKGVFDVIKTVGRLRKTFPGIGLRVIGKGDPEALAQVARLVDQNDLRSCFELVGYVPYDKLPEQYAWADVFAAPSVYEGGPGNVYLEAMACGKPVIACAAGGVPEVAPHMQCAWLIPPHDLAALETAMAALADDPALRDRLGREGRRRVEETFAIEKYLDRCEGFYRELL